MGHANGFSRFLKPSSFSSAWAQSSVTDASRAELGSAIPLLTRRGGRDIKKMTRSLLIGADGGPSPRKPDRAQPSRKVVAHTGTLTCERPPRLRHYSGLRRNFLHAAATPPHEEGNKRAIIRQKTIRANP